MKMMTGSVLTPTTGPGVEGRDDRRGEAGTQQGGQLVAQRGAGCLLYTSDAADDVAGV